MNFEKHIPKTRRALQELIKGLKLSIEQEKCFGKEIPNSDILLKKMELRLKGLK